MVRCLTEILSCWFRYPFLIYWFLDWWWGSALIIFFGCFSYYIAWCLSGVISRWPLVALLAFPAAATITALAAFHLVLGACSDPGTIKLIFALRSCTSMVASAKSGCVT